MGKLKKILIMAGGTGGHVFPGLAVAKKLREQGVEVHWLGTEKGMEAQWVSEAGFPLHFMRIQGMRGKGLLQLLKAPWRLLLAVMQSKKILQHVRPDVVLGMGGFVSGPGGIASAVLRIPLVIHEQNAKAGMTNSWLSRVAVRVLQGFPNTFPAHPNVITTGNPVRADIANLPPPLERLAHHESPLRLLVIGGSLGAAAINHFVPKALAALSEAERPEVYHQTGEKHFQETVDEYQELKVNARIKPFIQDMAEAYGWADIILCRAGASTIAELCAAGLGAILVPYPFAVDDHQTLNANFMAAHKAARLVQQKDLTEDNLVGLLRELKQEKCREMAQFAYQLRKVDAAEEVARICEEVCR